MIDYPVYYVFTHSPFDVSTFGERMSDTFSDGSKKFVLFYSDEYYYELGMYCNFGEDN